MNIDIAISIRDSEPSHGDGININNNIPISITIPITIPIPTSNSEPFHGRGAANSENFLSFKHEEVSKFQYKYPVWLLQNLIRDTTSKRFLQATRKSIFSILIRQIKPVKM